MAKMNWEKANRARAWRPDLQPQLPPATMRASDKQLAYLCALLERSGRRPLTIEEMGTLTIPQASRLIKELRDA